MQLNRLFITALAGLLFYTAPVSAGGCFNDDCDATNIAKRCFCPAYDDKSVWRQYPGRCASYGGYCNLPE
ncbi:unnamed protein product [Zymoseptoria tritici ST99CH_1A5]|uniref:Extracellular membrane protein CFEM domain-containing protein n=2 Tax=Zymoseptoria tritici TaxID=1047171 RepID=A0A2H1GJI7_ZYMTR|nr:unnamed protein product [Zymoseptoria tritici ST99CH_1E4]SMR56057.1 unnamed protein product [Zymoseptoria tritici ST99CH_3D1]SMY25244.1 unnamed protein product [Zymoseptoria tritici ST99CH_1A5]